MMESLVQSGHLVDLALAVLVVEVVVLIVLRHRDRRRLTALIASALPGACLLLALRASLTGAGWLWVVVFLTLSLPAHLADLRLRSI